MQAIEIIKNLSGLIPLKGSKSEHYHDLLNCVKNIAPNREYDFYIYNKPGYKLLHELYTKNNIPAAVRYQSVLKYKKRFVGSGGFIVIERFNSCKKLQKA